jgi:hypothetical protein
MDLHNTDLKFAILFVVQLVATETYRQLTTLAILQMACSVDFYNDVIPDQ